VLETPLDALVGACGVAEGVFMRTMGW
jgi:hypothetical protein